jgi:hypothetical protein
MPKSQRTFALLSNISAIIFIFLYSQKEFFFLGHTAGLLAGFFAALAMSTNQGKSSYSSYEVDSHHTGMVAVGVVNIVGIISLSVIVLLIK